MTRMPANVDARPRRPIPPADGAVAPAPAADRSRLAAVHRAAERDARRWTGPIVGAQFVAYVVAGAIQPAPANDAVAWHWLGVLLNVAFVVALAIAALTADRPRTSLRGSLGAGLVGLALVAGCPATGHHDLAGWWYGQGALFAAATALPAIVWWRLRAASRGA